MLCIAAGALAAASLLAPLACALWPALARLWLRAVFIPVSGALSALADRCPFPLFELLAPLFLALLIFCLFRHRRAACLLLAVALAGYGFCWAPAYFLPDQYSVEAEADAASLTVLCAALVQRLNAQPPPDLPVDLGDAALEVAALAATPAPVRAAPKAVRYPEWMRALSLAGLYAPWTGEALYDDTAPAAGQPFTAVHELMHMGGVADEGQANIHAYIACQRYGGAFAYSADLWALKYAAEALLALDAQACAARLSALGDAARRDLSALGLSAAEPAAPSLLPSAIAQKTGDYGALAAWLAARIV